MINKNYSLMEIFKKVKKQKEFPDLSNVKITSLPDNLKVGGHLDLAYTKITSLPKDLKKIGNYIHITDPKMISLIQKEKLGKDALISKDLKKGAYVDITDPKINSFLRKAVSKNLINIDDMKLVSLPDDFD